MWLKQEQLMAVTDALDALKVEVVRPCFGKMPHCCSPRKGLTGAFSRGPVSLG